MLTVRIGLVGDYSRDVRAHLAIPDALAASARRFEATVHLDWLPTDRVAAEGARLLEPLDAVWCVPGSPYASMDGALAAIRHARERGVPFLGTCGGFQHMLIEYARAVLGLTDADHAESNPRAATPLITPLACSLVGQEGPILIAPGSLAAAAYEGAGRGLASRERYHCSFGLNPAFRDAIARSPLRISGRDDAGEVRVVELPGHPFFLGTLFQPELSSTADAPHPLIVAFVRAAAPATADSVTRAVPA